MSGAELKKRRLAAGLSQAGIAETIGVSQAAVSNWERGAAVPLEKVEALEATLGAAANNDDQDLLSAGQNYGEWLRTSREQQGLSRKELSESAGVSYPQLFNIETGRTANPRDATRAKLEMALETKPPEALIRRSRKRLTSLASGG